MNELGIACGGESVCEWISEFMIMWINQESLMMACFS